MFARLYWILPLFSALVWVSMLSAMIAWWCTTGRPHYPSMEPDQYIAYISDVGAFYLNPLFITGSCITVVFLDAGMIAERWLRHNGRLAPNTSFNQRWLSVASILAAIAGAIGLILLSIYNTYDYPNMHDRCLIVFIAGYLISAVFICAEYGLLGLKFKRHPILIASFYIKLFFICVELALAIAFGYENTKGSPNTGGILEWTVSFVFTLYVLTFVMDLLPAVRTKHHMSHPTVTELNEYDGPNGYTNGHPKVGTNGTNGNYGTGYLSHGGVMEAGGRDRGFPPGSANY